MQKISARLWVDNHAEGDAEFQATVMAIPRFWTSTPVTAGVRHGESILHSRPWV